MCDTRVLHVCKARGQRTLWPEALGHVQLCVDFAEVYSLPCESVWKHLVTCVKCKRHSWNASKCIWTQGQTNTAGKPRSWVARVEGTALSAVLRGAQSDQGSGCATWNKKVFQPQRFSGRNCVAFLRSLLFCLVAWKSSTWNQCSHEH